MVKQLPPEGQAMIAPIRARHESQGHCRANRHITEYGQEVLGPGHRPLPAADEAIAMNIATESARVAIAEQAMAMTAPDIISVPRADHVSGIKRSH